MLIVISIICLGSCSEAKQEEAAVRTAEVDLVDSGYFETVENTNTDTEYRTVAKKKISGEALQGYETASLTYEDYLITFDVVINIENGTIILNIYFDDTEEVIIENFVGIPMKNYNNEDDILFVIEEEHLFLSELRNLSNQEQCSFLSSFCGKVKNLFINVNLIIIEIIEPVFQLVFFTLSPTYDTLYKLNYDHNCSRIQPTGFITDQRVFGDSDIVDTKFGNTGCGIVAGYNLLYALGKKCSLPKVILQYESLGIVMLNAYGLLGSNPYQIYSFLDYNNISYTKVTNYKTFESLMNNKEDYYVLLSYWTGNNLLDPLHIYFIDKVYMENIVISQKYLNVDGQSNTKIRNVIYNTYNNYYSEKSFPVYNVSSLFDVNLKKLIYMCIFYRKIKENHHVKKSFNFSIFHEHFCFTFLF